MNKKDFMPAILLGGLSAICITMGAGLTLKYYQDRDNIQEAVYAKENISIETIKKAQDLSLLVDKSPAYWGLVAMGIGGIGATASLYVAARK